MLAIRPAGSDFIAATFRRLRKRMQGYAACVISLTAEPKHAEAVAFREAEKSLAVLSAFSPANLFLELVSHCVPSGQEYIERRHSISFDEEHIPRPHDGTASPNPIAVMPWMLHARDIELYERGPVGRLSEILKNPKPSEFENVVLSAVGHYSRSARSRTPIERTVHMLVALESLLLRNDGEAIQQNVGERLAFAVGKDVDARKAVIRNVKAVYRLRSRFLRHGKEVEDHAIFRQFFWYMWEFMFRIVEWTRSLQTKTDCLDLIDHRKLS